MKEFIEYLIRSIVNNPDSVSVTEEKYEQDDIYHVKVAPDDMGIVIGKEGKTIRALRNLAKAKAIKDNVMIRVILDEENTEEHNITTDDQN